MCCIRTVRLRRCSELSGFYDCVICICTPPPLLGFGVSEGGLGWVGIWERDMGKVVRREWVIGLDAWECSMKTSHPPLAGSLLVDRSNATSQSRFPLHE